LSDLVSIGIYKTSFKYKRQDRGIVMMAKKAQNVKLKV